MGLQVLCFQKVLFISYKHAPLGRDKKMEIEFVLGLSPPGTSRPGLVKMRDCTTLFEFGPCLFPSSPVISSILLFLFLFYFPLSFFGLSMILLLLSQTGVFGGFIRIMLLIFP